MNNHEPQICPHCLDTNHSVPFDGAKHFATRLITTPSKRATLSKAINAYKKQNKTKSRGEGVCVGGGGGDHPRKICSRCLDTNRSIPLDGPMDPPPLGPSHAERMSDTPAQGIAEALTRRAWQKPHVCACSTTGWPIC